MTDDNQFELSRRNVLGGLGAIGLASAGAGLGTTAYFSDSEIFENNTLAAGELDLKLDYRATYLGGDGRLEEIDGFYPGFDVQDLGDGNYLIGEMPPAEVLADPEFDFCRPEADELLINGDEIPIFELEDVKPGDCGCVQISLHICDNPAWVEMYGDLTENAQNGYTEPELDALEDLELSTDNPDGEGQLADALEAVVYYGEKVEHGEEPDNVMIEGSLADVLAAIADGVLLDGDVDSSRLTPFAGAMTHYVTMEWCLPTTVGNEVQTDSVGFDIGFYAEQSRHNPRISSAVGDGWLTVEENFAQESMTARGRFGSNGSPQTWEVGIWESSQTDDEDDYTWTSGETVPFSFEYDANSNASSFDLDGVEVAATGGAPQGRVGIQAKADQATIAVENLVLVDSDGDPVTVAGPDGVTASNDGPDRDLRYLVVNTDAALLSNGFALAGDVTVTLEGDYDTDNEEGVAFDVVVE